MSTTLSPEGAKQQISMSTTLSPEGAKQQILKSAEDKRLYRLWRAFPDSPVGEERAWEIIERVEDREGDSAFAGAQLLSLKLLEIVREVGGGSWQKADVFPDLIDDFANVQGTDLYNKKLEEQHEETRKRLQRQDEQRDREYRESPAYRERAETEALVAEAVSEQLEPLRERLTEIEVKLAAA